MTGSELYITFGHQRCTVSLMNQGMTLFDFNWGRKAVTLPVLSMLPQQLQDLATRSVVSMLPQQLQNLATGSGVVNMLPQQLRNLATANLVPSADCSNAAPSIGVTGSRLNIDFGHNSCEVTFMGRTVSLEWNLGSTGVDLPGLSILPQQLRDLATVPLSVINAQMTFATGIANCVNADQPLGLIECLGYKIIERVPPLSYLNRMSDILTEARKGIVGRGSGASGC